MNYCGIMKNKKFCIIGLGYFGYYLSLQLAEAGAEVLAIDKNPDRIDLVADKVTYAVAADSTDSKALGSLGLKDMDAVIVAIGEGFESSINTIAVLQEIGVKRILARIISPIHERLLKLMNIEELLVPEADAAAHLSSRLLITGLLESFDISEDYGIFEIEAPKDVIGKTLIESKLREEFQLNLVTIKRRTQTKSLLKLSTKENIQVIGVPTPDLKFLEGDILVLFGKRKDFKVFFNQ